MGAVWFTSLVLCNLGWLCLCIRLARERDRLFDEIFELRCLLAAKTKKPISEL